MVKSAVDHLREHTYRWGNSGLHLSKLDHPYFPLEIDAANRAFALRLADCCRHHHAFDVPRERSDAIKAGHADVNSYSSCSSPANDALRKRSELEQPAIMDGFDTVRHCRILRAVYRKGKLAGRVELI